MTWAYLLFAVVVGGLSWSLAAGAQWHSARVLFWIDLVLGVLCLLAVPFRRRWPRAVPGRPGAAPAVSLGAGVSGMVCRASRPPRRCWREILPTAGVAA